MSYQVGPKEKLVWFFFYIYDKFFFREKNPQKYCFSKKKLKFKMIVPNKFELIKYIINTCIYVYY